MNTWDGRWLELSTLIATWSKDRSTGVGCVIVGGNQRVVSLGWNGFPRRINDNVEQRHERPEKYLWTHHAEQNAICNAAAIGHMTHGCTMYVSCHPCAACTRELIQSGIKRLVTIHPDRESEEFKNRWGRELSVSKEMLNEAHVSVLYV